MTARREEVGTASRGKADEEEVGPSSALLYSQTDSERPIGSVSQCCQRKTVETITKHKFIHSTNIYDQFHNKET